MVFYVLDTLAAQNRERGRAVRNRCDQLRYLRLGLGFIHGEHASIY